MTPFRPRWPLFVLEANESVFGKDRLLFILDVSWPIDDGSQTVTKTFYPPFTKVDREEYYRRG